MKKTSLYIEYEVDRALDRIARSEGRSKADLIREVLAKRAGEAPRPSITAIGIGNGPGDVADNVDRHLAETGFGER